MSVLDSSPNDTGASIRGLAEGLLRQHPHLAHHEEGAGPRPPAAAADQPERLP